MKSQKTTYIKSWFFHFIFVLGLINTLSFYAQVNSQNFEVCKQLAIESAQLADITKSYAQSGYFETNQIIVNQQIDTAIMAMNDAMIYIDSMIVSTSDSALLALNYAKTSKAFGLKAYRTLMSARNSSDFIFKKELLKKVINDSENATIDAYHASLYASDKKIKNTEKEITKLDMDQVLFVLLNEDLKNKSDALKEEIKALKDQIAKSKNKADLAKLKKKLKSLESKEKEFDGKLNDAHQKLTDIDKQIEEKNKNKSDPKNQKDEVFSKSISSKNTESNQISEGDSELPETLVYQVQLGVFQKILDVEKFGGITPIYYKKGDKGIAYSAGIFERYVEAQEAKDVVHSIGLVNSFIVAYYKQKRITVAEALKLEKK
jgi:hypothetical protein